MRRGVLLALGLSVTAWAQGQNDLAASVAGADAAEVPLPDGGAPQVLTAPPPPPAQPAPEDPFDPPKDFSRITLSDGQSFSAHLLSTSPDGTVELELGSGARFTLPPSAVRSVEKERRTFVKPSSGETMFLDPNRTRYLYGPSGMMLKRNELSFSQVEVLGTMIGWGVTDFLSLQAGAVIPVWFLSPLGSGFHLMLAVKAGGQVAPKVHLAVGAQAVWLPGVNFGGGPGGGGTVPILGIAFGTATYGDRDAHVSLSVGLPLSGINPGAALASPIFSVSGNLRLARTVALVSENWLIANINSSTPFGLLNTLAVRLMGEKIAVDLGLFIAWSNQGLVVPIPIPIVSFTYNFG